ncbi:MAG: RagB/SusD family nutrient uptake outer membrane protein [Bacteroidales bacterium]|jgi:tetratricopeptide (TPR) repeat protein|nr:RagB/SusD family nutrient uptake outer membrane protein [Bacteroidales bacterium]
MKKYIIGFITCLAMIASCADKLELAPANAITEEQIKELLASGDNATIDKVLGGMANSLPLRINAEVDQHGGANPMINSLFGVDYMHSLVGNDIVFGARSTGIFGSDYYQRTVLFHSGELETTTSHWCFGWSCITQANKLLALLTDEVVGSNAKMQEYKARALTLRSYGYNHLMENFGNGTLGIMLYDTYSISQPKKARASMTDTYDFIKGDLQQAIALFTEAGVGYTADVRDFDLAVANFILARVSLCSGDYATAISACDRILDQYPQLIDETHYGGKDRGPAVTDAEFEFRPDDNAFLNNAINPEVIFGFPKGVGNVGRNTYLNIFGRRYGGMDEGFARIDSRLYNKIADDDFRKASFQGASDLGDYTYPVTPQTITIPSYVNLKFASTHPLGTLGDDDRTYVGETDCYYMRTSEVILMKAEAQVQSNNDPGARATLNTLLAARTKAGAPTLTVDNYPAHAGLNTLGMVQLQSRIEMWGEGGLEYYNNRRWNIPADRSGATNHYATGTLPVSSMTREIPLMETMWNPNCQKNF